MVIPCWSSRATIANRFDRIAIVDCPEALQIKRVMARNGLAAAEVEAIMAAQASRQARLAVADDVIATTPIWRHCKRRSRRCMRSIAHWPTQWGKAVEIRPESVRIGRFSHRAGV